MLSLSIAISTLVKFILFDLVGFFQADPNPSPNPSPYPSPNPNSNPNLKTLTRSTSR